MMEGEFDWERLPLEVYEKLLEFLGGLEVINLCLAHPQNAGRVWEVFQGSRAKRETRMRNFCIKDLDRTEALKMFISFDNMETLKRIEDFSDISNEGYMCGVLWEDIFMRYMDRWSAFTEGVVQIERFKELENKLKVEMQCADEVNRHAYKWTTGTLGGKHLYHFLSPCPSRELRHINTLGTKVEGQEVEFTSLASVCPNGHYFWGRKVVPFPLLCSYDQNEIVDVEPILLSACNACITSFPLRNDSPQTALVNWTPSDLESHSPYLRERCPVFEVLDNIIVIWPFPTRLHFFVLGQSHHPYINRPRCFAFWNLYTNMPTFPDMVGIWEELCGRPTHYLFQIQEVPGETANMCINGKRVLLGASGYLFHPSNLVSYGLAVVSHTRGKRIIKPSKDDASGLFQVDSTAPLYFKKNAERFLNKILDPCCSAKKGGFFVFCSRDTMAASWDGVTWIFGSLSFPLEEFEAKDIDEEDGRGGVTHVQVLTEQGGVLLIFNQDILFVELSVPINIPKSLVGAEGLEDKNVELCVNPMRLLRTGLAALCLEVSQVEVNYEMGDPFLFLSANAKKCNAEAEQGSSSARQNVNSVLLRIDFK